MVNLAGAQVNTPAGTGGTTQAAAPATTQKSPLVGEQVPSEDASIKDFHSLGMVEGHVDIFRSASPTRDLFKKAATDVGDADLQKVADERLRHLASLGIRCIVSLENPDATEEGNTAGTAVQKRWIAAERIAAKNVGITFISHPVNNAGAASLQTMTDDQVLKLIDPIATEIIAQAKTGGVLFHCAAGHDRTGLVAAYIRLKWEHWPVDQAIAEMRRLGHNWPRYSSNGGESSWHEEHLRGIAELLKNNEG
jgi:hypothetical protein